MAYTPNPADASEPLDSRPAGTSSAEFRTLKQYIASQLALKASTADVDALLTEEEVDAKDQELSTAILQYVATNYVSIQNTLNLVYPVGSLYINLLNAANPSTYLNFGTWNQMAPYELSGHWVRTA